MKLYENVAHWALMIVLVLVILWVNLSLSGCSASKPGTPETILTDIAVDCGQCKVDIHRAHASEQAATTIKLDKPK